MAYMIKGPFGYEYFKTLKDALRWADEGEIVYLVELKPMGISKGGKLCKNKHKKPKL